MCSIACKNGNSCRNKRAFIIPTKEDNIHACHVHAPLCVIDMDYECSICMEDGDHKNSVLLQCGHAFHKTCFAKWGKHNPCPICKQKAVISSISYNNLRKRNAKVLENAMKILKSKGFPEVDLPPVTEINYPSWYTDMKHHVPTEKSIINMIKKQCRMTHHDACMVSKYVQTRIHENLCFGNEFDSSIVDWYLFRLNILVYDYGYRSIYSWLMKGWMEHMDKTSKDIVV